MIAEGIDTTELAIYLFGYVCSKLGVRRDELEKAVVLRSPHGTEVEEKVNYIEMVASKEAREKEREDNRQTQAKIFLQLAREKFPRVPKRLERQIRGAKLEQINDWLSRLLKANDLDSLIATPAKG